MDFKTCYSWHKISLTSLFAFHHCFLIMDTKEQGERTKFSLTFFTECLNQTIFWDRVTIVFTHDYHMVFAASMKTRISQIVFMKRAKRLNINIVKINNTCQSLRATSCAASYQWDDNLLELPWVWKFKIHYLRSHLSGETNRLELLAKHKFRLHHPCKSILKWTLQEWILITWTSIESVVWKQDLSFCDYLQIAAHLHQVTRWFS